MRVRALLPAAAALLALTACGGDSGGATPPPAASSPGISTAAPSSGPPQAADAACQNSIRACMQQRSTPPPQSIDPTKSYSATVHTSRGDFTLALDAAVAPVTVNNFVYLAQNHYYDGLTFHRVEPGFVVQGGDPLGNGTGGPGYKLPDETNKAPWVAGSLGMASNAAGVSGSQFFILLGDAPSLSRSGVYNHFGSVSTGKDVVGSIKVGDLIKSIDITAA